MHTGHQYRVDELEYGNLLVEACSLVNSETNIHRLANILESKCVMHVPL